MRSGVVVFPGSNCDRDLETAISSQSFDTCQMLWHKETTLPNNLDILFIPGGFSFGDYLRCGAIAASSPIMKSILKFAQNGGYIVGICNGFQILTEAGLLEGTLLRNSKLNFICKQQSVVVTNNGSIITKNFSNGEILHLPIAHHDGNYFADDDTLNKIEGNGQVLFRYADNPNGSKNNIAGIMSENHRVIGLMPHPERAVNEVLGSSDGSKIFKSLFENI
ncbi:MAG: phosphoribosylformylglycinamidine synthase subunit PurQ [Rhodobacteraceae bacterium]|nr:MAG: phosphoribosylformylglycinamidine synthase subunit PurQ [Paracoccaceae bacterium]